ncbi:MAG: hypothetical protein HY553_04915 [Elusimicrobia bacterium]|nr:hypothetical protein [Elusimicrobiota bacterium]
MCCGEDARLRLMLARWIDRVRINTVEPSWREGRRIFIKRRLPYLAPVLLAGNVFLRLSRSRIRMFVGAGEWAAWERTSFELLHGAEGSAGPVGRDALYTTELPGIPLLRLAGEGELRAAAVRAAGVELARAHGLATPARGPWSHGDPHLANFLYDEAAGRARLVDFETRHEPDLPAIDRHADDLLVFLLDLLGRCPEASWPELAREFLSAYGAQPAIERLRGRLVFPRGLERTLWACRTNHLSSERLRGGLRRLASALDGVAASG